VHPKAGVSTVVPLLEAPATSFQHSHIVSEQGVGDGLGLRPGGAGGAARRAGRAPLRARGAARGGGQAGAGPAVRHVPTADGGGGCSCAGRTGR
jgi:hypothetical protein